MLKYFQKVLESEGEPWTLTPPPLPKKNSLKKTICVQKMTHSFIDY